MRLCYSRFMNEAEFETTYRETLLAIEDVFEHAIEDDADLDYETINDILNVEFDDGSAVIVTKQGATQQLWVAAVSGGFHFEYSRNEANEAGQWLSTIDQQSLADKLYKICQLQGKIDLDFSSI